MLYYLNGENKLCLVQVMVDFWVQLTGATGYIGKNV